MRPFYVDTISCNFPETPGIDKSYINLNCKNIFFELKENDFVKVSKNSHVLHISKIEKVENDGIFNHWRLITQIVTINKNDHFEPAELKPGQYFYKVENPTE